jgi:hypothetical protein
MRANFTLPLESYWVLALIQWPIARLKLRPNRWLSKPNSVKPITAFEKIACGWWSWWSFDKSPRHAETILRRLATDVFPAYGHKPIDVVTVTDIRKLMLAVQAEVQET